MSDQTSDPTSVPFDMQSCIASAMQDPERSSRIADHRDEIVADRERYVERSMLTIFANIVEAGSLTGTEREAKLEQTLELIREDPGLIDSFVNMLLDDEVEPEVIERAQEAMLFASDPFTGVIPEGFAFPPEIQAQIDASPELQAYRDQLVADAQRENDERWARVADALGL